MTGVLLHVGYGKTGSTYLQKEWLPRHPQLAFRYDTFGGATTTSTFVEQALRCTAPPRYYVLSEEQLGAGFPAGRGYLPIVTGEPVTAESGRRMRENQARVCRLLADLFPQARVLLVTRGFESALRSIYSEAVRLGYPRDCAAFLRDHRPHLLQWLDIDYLVDLYTKAFGRSALCLLPFELLREDAVRFVRTLERELGLDPHDVPTERVHASLTPEELYWYTAISRHTVARLVPHLPERRALWLYRRFTLGVMKTGAVAGFIRRLGRVSSRRVALDIPPDYLEAFRGQAQALRERPYYEPYLAGYLLRSSHGRAVPAAASAAVP
jgi:hypothetical protein